MHTYIQYIYIHIYIYTYVDVCMHTCLYTWSTEPRLRNDADVTSKQCSLPGTSQDAPPLVCTALGPGAGVDARHLMYVAPSKLQFRCMRTRLACHCVASQCLRACSGFKGSSFEVVGRAQDLAVHGHSS